MQAGGGGSWAAVLGRSSSRVLPRLGNSNGAGNQALSAAGAHLTLGLCRVPRLAWCQAATRRGKSRGLWASDFASRAPGKAHGTGAGKAFCANLHVLSIHPDRA